MSDVKNRSLVGITTAIIILLIVISAFLLWAWPQAIEAAVGMPPLDGIRILTVAVALAAVVLLTGWLVESLSRRAGSQGLLAGWNKNKQKAALQATASETVDTPESAKKNASAQSRSARTCAFAIRDAGKSGCASCWCRAALRIPMLLFPG